MTVRQGQKHQWYLAVSVKGYIYKGIWMRELWKKGMLQIANSYEEMSMITGLKEVEIKTVKCHVSPRRWLFKNTT